MNSGCVEIRHVSKRGGSLALNIPSGLAKRMSLSPGCAVLLRYDDEKEGIIVEKILSVSTNSGKRIQVGRSKLK